MKTWKNWHISTRLRVSFMALVLMLAIGGTFSAAMLIRVGRSMDEFYEHQFQTVQDSWKAQRDMYALRTNILRSMLEDTVQEATASVDSAKGYYESAKASIEDIKTTFLGDQTGLNNAMNTLKSVETGLQRTADLSLSEEDDANARAFALYESQIIPQLAAVCDTLDDVTEFAGRKALDHVETADAATRSAVVAVSVLVVFSIVLGIVLANVVSNGIIRPVLEMRDAARQLSEGQLDAAITYESEDSLGLLADHMRHLIATFRKIIGDIEYQLSAMGKGDFTVASRCPEEYVGQFARIRDAIEQLDTSINDTLSQIDISADQVSVGSSQVSSGAQALAQGSAEQASSVQELAATIDTINGQVESTAEHAKDAQEDNQKTHDQIAVCSQHMNDLMEAMQEIENKSQDISKVIKTIEDIAFQTNILALNAAVEAARAGAAGKGFAVVADEVRNLATKSQEASASTSTLIEDTVKAVKEGARLTAETNESLREVVVRAEKVRAAVTRISAATGTQSHDVGQVTSAVDQISTVVQTNSATAEESAAASEELSGQADVLKELVNRFQLRRTDGDAPRPAAARAKPKTAVSA